jgi:hypothetical protein
VPTSDQFIVCELARLAWQEGHHESQNVMTAIALVQSNRVKAGLGEGNWLAVFSFQRQIWSAWKVPDRHIQYYDTPDVRDPAFQAILATADLVYEGAEDTLTDGALYYADLRSPYYDKDGWFAFNVAGRPGKHPRVATIGGFTFYK